MKTTQNNAAEMYAAFAAEVAHCTRWLRIYAERGCGASLMPGLRARRERAWQQMAQITIEAEKAAVAS